MLKRTAMWILCLGFTVQGVFALEGRLFFHPDLYQDKAVFTFEDDLWLADLNTGTADRITSHPGYESYAKFSPDGKWIAFTANYDGGTDVYLMPSTGGEPIRLTYHPTGDYVQGFSSDGSHVLFTSRREFFTQLYQVPVSGGYPELIPLDQVRYASFAPDGTKVAYNRFASDRMNWKGYKGGRQQDIWVADLPAGTFTKMTSWAGYDVAPMWFGKMITFASDREDKRMNLYSLDTSSGTVTRLTFLKDWDVEMPSLDESTGNIVYVASGRLNIYDPAARESRVVPITIPTDRWQMRDFSVDPADYIHSVSPGSKDLIHVVESRGDIFLIDDEKEKTVNLTATSGSRELEPALSPDGSRIAFFSDKTGEFELYVMDAKRGAEWKQLTQGSRTFYYHIQWSPDGKKILFGDKNYTLTYISVDTGQGVIVDDGRYLKDNEIFWEVSDYTWSPDSRYIAYSLPVENMNNAITLYDTTTGEKHPLTNGYYDDYSPAFDTNGRYLYFLSNRHFKPLLDPFMDNNVNIDMTRVMMVQLQNGEPYPFTLRWKAFLDEWKPADPVTVSIDFEGLSQRIFSTPVEPGTYKSLKAGSLQVWYLSKESFGFPGIEEFFHPKSVRDYTLKSYDMKEKDGKDVLDGIGFFELSADRSNIAYMAGKTTGIVDAATGGKVGDGKVQWYGTDYTVNTSAEYAQIFRDVWRQIRDFFYDPNIHGKNWPGIYAKYAELVPFVATREDINYLIGEMIGELTASHEYIIGDGGPQRTSFDRVRAGLLGASIELDKEARLYRITRVLQGRSDRDEYRSPLQAPDIGNVEGFYILRIDGEDVLPNRNFWSYLEGKSGKEITMTVNKKPEIKDARTITLETLRSEYALRYWDSIQRNIERVRKATDDRIGYMHLSDMDEEGLSQFEEAFRALRYKDGLIIDVRYNGGGFVSWFMIDKLERLVHFLAQTRDFAPMYYPHGTRRGPIVVLCNEGTGSDGEVFTEHFKEAGLGTVVGTRTWGGLIGIINMVPLLDGGMVTQSNVGFANLRGSWVVENHGAEPDIAVEMSPEAILKDEDPQLDYAISLIQKQVKENPPVKLVPPPFPVK